MKHCKKCSQFLPKENFYKTKNSPDGLQTYCKLCMNTYKRDKEKYNKWMRNFRKKEHWKEYEKSFRRKYLQTFAGIASKLYSSAKVRSKKNSLEFNLDTEWIMDKMKPLVCEVTRLPLTFLKYDNKKYLKSPFNPSIDRIDNSKGYTKDNCRIVCWIYNMAKSEYQDSDVLTMAKALVKSVHEK